MKSNFVDFSISQDESGHHAMREDIRITVADDDSKIFHRRAVKPFAIGGASQESLLVCRLGDVYLYCNGNGNFIMTKQADIKP